MDWLVLLTPILLLPIVWLCAFVGCQIDTSVRLWDLQVKVQVPFDILDRRPRPDEPFLVQVTVTNLIFPAAGRSTELRSTFPRPASGVAESVLYFRAPYDSPPVEVEIFASVRNSDISGDAFIWTREPCRGIIAGEHESRGFVTFQSPEPDPSTPGRFVFVRHECEFVDNLIGVFRP
ncbi:MAG TPA: hypothetical protein VID04_08850 [Methylomirabilota bacterium]|jgi:hypothetical protein